MTRRVQNQTRIQRARMWVVALFVVAIGGASGAVLAPSAAVAGQESTVTWSMRPADANGPDGRSWAELELDPGETTTQFAAITNLSEVPAVFALTAADGYLTETGRFSMLASTERSTDGGTWISVQESVDLGPGQMVVVPFTVSVPADATPGDHPAGIAASMRSTGTGQDGSEVNVESRIGFRVMTRVTGELHASLDVDDVQVSYTNSWNPFEPGALTIRLRAVNAGNVAVTLTDEVNVQGRTVDAADDGTATVLFPGDDGTIVREVDGIWPLGAVTGEIILASAVEGADAATTEPQSASFTAWAVPWSQLLFLGGVGLLFLAVFVHRRRGDKRVQRLIAEAREEGGQRAVSEPGSQNS